jgi:ATP-dependent Clp protease ATP-binding subunit ClpC
MFERYTESARRTLFFARYEASELGSMSIDPEHLLLGLLRDSRALSTLTQVSPEGLRQEIEKAVVCKEKLSTSVEIPFTNASMRVLQFAADEADALRHDYIGTEHLLLGLLREEQSAAAAALAAHGVRLRDVREAVKKLPGRLEAAPQAGVQDEVGFEVAPPGLQDTVDGIKSLVADLARAPRDSREARDLVTRIQAALDALLNDSGLR